MTRIARTALLERHRTNRRTNKWIKWRLDDCWGSTKKMATDVASAIQHAVSTVSAGILITEESDSISCFFRRRRTGASSGNVSSSHATAWYGKNCRVSGRNARAPLRRRCSGIDGRCVGLPFVSSSERSRPVFLMESWWAGMQSTALDTSWLNDGKGILVQSSTSSCSIIDMNWIERALIQVSKRRQIRRCGRSFFSLWMRDWWFLLGPSNRHYVLRSIICNFHSTRWMLRRRRVSCFVPLTVRATDGQDSFHCRAPAWRLHRFNEPTFNTKTSFQWICFDITRK